MLFDRSQEIHVTAFVILNCTHGSQLHWKWIVLQCAPICRDEVSLTDSIETTTDELTIPARMLAIGFYELRLRVTSTATPVINVSISVFIEMTHSSVVTNLVATDTAMLVHEYQQSLLLNPGKLSVDSNTLGIDPNVITRLRCYREINQLVLGLAFHVLLPAVRARRSLSSS